MVWKGKTVPFDLVCMFYTYFISGVEVSVFEASIVDRVFGTGSGQIKEKRCMLLLH